MASTIFVLALLLPQRAVAGRAEWAAAKGQGLARKGDCVAAAPLLEEAELARHRPTTASALAGCYVSLGELLRAHELYQAIAEEEPSRGWTVGDRRAAADAKSRASELDARIPTITLSFEESFDDIDVLINGKSWADPLEPKRVAPDTAVEIEVSAKGTDVFTTRLVLPEGERRTVKVHLERKTKSTAPTSKPRAPEGPTTWVGARFRGYLIPKFLLNAFYDSGSTIFAPGGGITLQTRAGDALLTFSLGYANYRVPEMPIKPVGTPDTEYEIVESDLQALFATIDIMFDKQLDDAGKWTGRIGLGVGVGWMFFGNLFRTQAYPTKLSGTDPYLYAKCKGPNDPFGTFRYCNQLDADATHYPGYTEPSWFDGGKLPALFPYLAIPQLGLTWNPASNVAIDIDLGASITGIMIGMGFRYGL